MFIRVSSAIAVALTLGGAASAHEAHGRSAGILDELPAHAPPGECYARVKVPGQAAGPPPMMMGARWTLNPGPPGSPGPIWCLVPTGPQPAPAVETPARFGWIRVLCDSDVTPERVGRIQRELHEHGYYRGSVSGRYDAETSAAVSKFQTERHIAHGGYLSLETLDALEAYQEDYSYGGYATGYGYESSGAYGGYGYGYGAPPYPQVPAYPQSLYAQPGYGPTPPYAARSAVQNGWLTWSGKTQF